MRSFREPKLTLISQDVALCVEEGGQMACLSTAPVDLIRKVRNPDEDAPRRCSFTESADSGSCCIFLSGHVCYDEAELLKC